MTTTLAPEPTDAPACRRHRVMFWAGWAVTAVPVLFMFVGGIYFGLFDLAMVREGTRKLGYPEHLAGRIVALEVTCAALYLIPQTAVLGAILLTAYLGGATASHVRAGEPWEFPVAFGVVVWLGLYLRDARVRALVPLRKV